MNENTIEIIFVREYKHFICAFDRKSKEDYILNVSKIIKDKFNTKFIVPNKVQSFLLNYEIRKLLDKAISLKTKKYKRVVYLNSNLSYTTILNTIDFISNEYPDFVILFKIIENEKTDDLLPEIENLKKVIIE